MESSHADDRNCVDKCDSSIEAQARNTDTQNRNSILEFQYFEFLGFFWILVYYVIFKYIANKNMSIKVEVPIILG